MENVLEIKNLHQFFEQGTINENHVLKGIDFEMKHGEFVSIIGGNGAGKSTFLNSIAGSLPVDTGIIKVAGENITYQSVNKRSKLIGRVFQDPKMGTAPLLTIEENMAIALMRGQHRNFWSSGVKKRDRALFQEKLAVLGLGLENRLKSDVSLLSGGQRQALTLLMATLQRPELLLLDEHTAALDPKTSAVVMELTEKLIHDNELSALMITHNMEDAIRYGNRLIMLDHGKIAVDVSGEEKKNLTVPALLDLFKQSSNKELVDDNMLLG